MQKKNLPMVVAVVVNVFVFLDAGTGSLVATTPVLLAAKGASIYASHDSKILQLTTGMLLFVRCARS